MPISLKDINNTAVNTKTYSPKFFDEVLTGNGKNVGLLSIGRNPSHIPDNRSTNYADLQKTKNKIINGDTETQYIPFYVLSCDDWDYVTTLTKSNVASLTNILHNNSLDIYIEMQPYISVLETKTTKNQGKTLKIKTLTTSYQIFFYIVKDKNDTTFKTIHYSYAEIVKQNGNFYFTRFTQNPRAYFMEYATDFADQLNSSFNSDAINDYIDNYDLYTGICERSRVWQETISDELNILFQSLKQKANYSQYSLKITSNILRNLENYNVPLDLYRNIYQAIIANFPRDFATILCKQNLNLLLSDTLNNLHQNKAKLNNFTPSKTAVIDPKFSLEQKAAITATEPLIMVQSVAGSGKSSVVLARIKYMVDSGVDPKDITVLSFTNAAANNIMTRNPGVNAYTIAKMIHDIYSLNFVDHELSTIDTVINSLAIYYQNSDPMYKTVQIFRQLLLDIVYNKSNAFTKINNFIETHFDDIITILNTIKQTTLELEIMICYQKIDQLKEPTDIQSKYLIIDEVQDNSVFEFIYALKYCDKNKKSLFIVGDSSQCLYEFRASNPKALNVLESSNVFATYKLQTNYRSNQEILDFANIALANIEANQYANLQLRANSLEKVTAQSFQDRVHLSYYHLNALREIDDELKPILNHELKNYIDQCINNNQNIAFLAFTRHHAYLMKNILEEMYPNENILDLIPQKIYNSTIFSKFISRYWDEVQFIPTNNIMSVITQIIYTRLDALTSNAETNLPFVQKFINTWFSEEKYHIDAWQTQCLNGTMSITDFLNNVKTNMLRFEIRHNAVKQSLISLRNEEIRKAQLSQNAKIMISTIHSAKGLEFDNTVIIYQNSNTLSEEKKRMYYVAFTRAMQSEYILAFDTVKSPKIETDYKTVIESLPTN